MLNKEISNVTKERDGLKVLIDKVSKEKDAIKEDLHVNIVAWECC